MVGFILLCYSHGEIPISVYFIIISPLSTRGVHFICLLGISPTSSSIFLLIWKSGGNTFFIYPDSKWHFLTTTLSEIPEYLIWNPRTRSLTLRPFSSSLLVPHPERNWTMLFMMILLSITIPCFSTTAWFLIPVSYLKSWWSSVSLLICCFIIYPFS